MIEYNTVLFLLTLVSGVLAAMYFWAGSALRRIKDNIDDDVGDDFIEDGFTFEEDEIDPGLKKARVLLGIITTFSTFLLYITTLLISYKFGEGTLSEYGKREWAVVCSLVLVVVVGWISFGMIIGGTLNIQASMVASFLTATTYTVMFLILLGVIFGPDAKNEIDNMRDVGRGYIQ